MNLTACVHAVAHTLMYEYYSSLRVCVVSLIYLIFYFVYAYCKVVVAIYYRDGRSTALGQLDL